MKPNGYKAWRISQALEEERDRTFSLEDWKKHYGQLYKQKEMCYYLRSGATVTSDNAPGSGDAINKPMFTTTK